MEPERRHRANDYLEVQMADTGGAVYVVHLPSNSIIQKWAVIVGFEEIGWEMMIDFSEKIKDLHIDWELDSIEMMFPIDDPDMMHKIIRDTGFGEITVGEAHAKIMEKIIRESA